VEAGYFSRYEDRDARVIGFRAKLSNRHGSDWKPVDTLTCRENPGALQGERCFYSENPRAARLSWSLGRTRIDPGFIEEHRLVREEPATLWSSWFLAHAANRSRAGRNCSRECYSLAFAQRACVDAELSNDRNRATCHSNRIRSLGNERKEPTMKIVSDVAFVTQQCQTPTTITAARRLIISRGSIISPTCEHFDTITFYKYVKQHLISPKKKIRRDEFWEKEKNLLRHWKQVDSI